MVEIIKKNWLKHFLQELKNSKEVLIISPFISQNIVDHLLKNRCDTKIKLITRFNLNDFRSNVSNLSALKTLVEAGVQIKGVKSLHSKVFSFDTKSTIIGSANFTSGGFFNNYEFGVLCHDYNIVSDSVNYFKSLWHLDSHYLTADQIGDWQSAIEKSQNTKNEVQIKLPDYGKNASIIGDLSKRNVYIKFFGTGGDRADLTVSVKGTVAGTHCHWAATFPKGKGRPIRYHDGDIVYMARILYGNDYAIFGKGIALKHDRNRDIASPEDIDKIEWKKSWPIYIRVKEVQFIDGTMGDCPKMKDLTDNLGYDSFYNSQQDSNNGNHDFNINYSLRRQADIKLSDISAEWLETKFQECIAKYGNVDSAFLSSLYQGTPSLTDILNDLNKQNDVDKT